MIRLTVYFLYWFKGDGTRDGTGTCVCNVGYREDLCDECMDGFYEEMKNETHTICTGMYVTICDDMLPCVMVWFGAYRCLI